MIVDDDVFVVVLCYCCVIDDDDGEQIFWKYRGHDHFVFFSITINQMVGIGVKVFFMEICQNCTGTDALPCVADYDNDVMMMTMM